MIFYLCIRLLTKIDFKYSTYFVSILMYSIRYISCRKCFALCILTIILSIYSFSWTMRLIIYDDTLYYSVTFILIVLYSRCFKIARIIYVVCGMVHNLNILNRIVYKLYSTRIVFVSICSMKFA